MSVALLIPGVAIIIASFYFDKEPGVKATPIDWQVLGQVKFKPTWYAPYKTSVGMPSFSDSLMKLNRKVIRITGYFIPMELKGTKCALSKNPNKTCFFCGRGTIETVMVVDFKNVSPNFSSDELITVEGRLRIMNTFNDFIYRLDSARFVQVEK